MGDFRDPGVSESSRRSVPTVRNDGCGPDAHGADRIVDAGMIEQIDEHLSRMKKELVSELSATVAAAIREMAEEIRHSGPDAVSRKEACRRLGFGLTKLKAMISRGQICVCIGDPTRIPMSEIRRFTQPAGAATKPRRAGGRKKAPTYDPLADFEALGKRRR